MVFIYIEKLTQDALMSLSELITAIMTGQPWYIFKGPCRFSGRSYVRNFACEEDLQTAALSCWKIR
jgi:hypothetical protein